MPKAALALSFPRFLEGYLAGFDAAHPSIRPSQPAETGGARRSSSTAGLQRLALVPIIPGEMTCRRAIVRVTAPRPDDTPPAARPLSQPAHAPTQAAHGWQEYCPPRAL
jgi:hypothetical protein